MRRLAALCLAVAATAACSDPPSRAAGPEEFTVALSRGGGGGHAQTHLTGAEEVPARDTPAQGQATFRVDADETAIEYKLEVANIENVVQAHIHLAQAGANGPIVAWLIDPPVALPSGGGRYSGRLGAGTLTRNNLTGPLAGKEIRDLVAAIRAGGAYVNVHTNDGLPGANTAAGDFQSGEIRGQIDRGNLFN